MGNVSHEETQYLGQAHNLIVCEAAGRFKARLGEWK
jgi:hypothetical protein